MTPEEILAFWKSIRTEKTLKIIPALSSADEQTRNRAWKEAAMMGFLHHVITEYIDTVKSQE